MGRLLHPFGFGQRLDERKRRRRDAVELEHLLRPRLVQRERERERIASRIRDAVELTDCRDMCFPVLTRKPLGHVEDDVRTGFAEPLRKVRARFQADHFTEAAQRALYRGDRLRGIPLGKRIIGVCNAWRPLNVDCNSLARPPPPLVDREKLGGSSSKPALESAGT